MPLPSPPSAAALRALGYPLDEDGRLPFPPRARLTSPLSYEEQFAALEALAPRERVAAMTVRRPLRGSRACGACCRS